VKVSRKKRDKQGKALASPTSHGLFSDEERRRQRTALWDQERESTSSSSFLSFFKDSQYYVAAYQDSYGSIVATRSLEKWIATLLKSIT
jgi:hypothetical protein